MTPRIWLHSFALAAAWVVAAPLQAAEPAPEPLSDASGEAFDEQFLIHLRRHHEHGAEMAALAKQRAQNEAVKRAAEKMATSQQNEIPHIDQLLGPAARRDRDTAGITEQAHDGHADNAHAGHAAGKVQEPMSTHMMDRLEEAEGAEFDRVFVEQMIMHHTMGKRMTDMAKERATRDEVKSLAARTAESQQQEIDQLSRMAQR